jgi:enoyl-CoA hydratase/carnithine racemase
MTEGKVTIEHHGHVLLIGLDRVPKRNAFDVAMYHDLATAYGTLDRDPDYRQISGSFHFWQSCSFCSASTSKS